MRVLLIFSLLLSGLLARAQKFQLTGEVKSLKEGSWVYLSYGLNGERMLDSAQVKGGKFRFSGKLRYPVMASLCESSDELYEGENRFSFMLEPAKFGVFSDNQLAVSIMKNSKLNDERQELTRRVMSFSFLLQRNRVIEEYPEYRRPGEQVMPLSDNAEERKKQEAVLTDSVCVEFAKEYPDSYASALVLASIMAWNRTDSAIYKRAESVFNRCARRWRKAPVVKEIIQQRMPRPWFSFGKE